MDTQILPPVNPLERSSVYSDELLRNICQTIRNGATLTAAIRMHGIGHETFYGWMRASQDVSDMVSRARAEVRAKVEVQFTNDALTGEDWRARHAYLQSHPDTRAEWGPNLNLSTVPIDRFRELLEGQSGNEPAWPTLQQLAIPGNSEQEEQDQPEPGTGGRE